jgi:N-acylglucosamine-6-phosphate 2-epimerase
MNKLIESLRDGLIVSCQAPEGSPLCKPEIIAAFAETAEQRGAVGVRIDSPENIRAVKSQVKIPVLGIYKIVSGLRDVYITPTFTAAKQIVEAGADIIALDATRRARPDDEKLEKIIESYRADFSQPIMADIALFEEGLYAAETLGVDVISTTLSGYTAETNYLTEPDFKLLEQLAAKLKIPVVCEGRLRSTEDVRRAFDCGAFAVVVGGAITGVDLLVQKFAAATPLYSAKSAEYFVKKSD